jgi:anti-sigma factor (TIGR02949 family)
MNTSCEDIRRRLGEFIDGELAASSREQVKQHMSSCERCRRELARLESLTHHLAGEGQAKAPAGLWSAIESRLERAGGGTPGPVGQPRVRPRLTRLAARPLAAAAAVLLVVGIGWLATSSLSESTAVAAQIDFRPLMEQAGGDVGAGIQALMDTYGGQAISAGQAAERMKVRIAAPDELPGGMHLEGRYMLHMGRSHRSLAFHYTAPGGKHLLLLQCPPKIEKNYGGFECMACSAGGRDGEGVRVGELHLMHMGSDNVCVCVVTTLDDAALNAALSAVKITF